MKPDLSALDDSLDDAGVDGFLVDAASDDSDQLYLSGFDAPDPFHALYDGEVHLLVSSLEYGRANSESHAASVDRHADYEMRRKVEEYGRLDGTRRVLAEFLDRRDVASVATKTFQLHPSEERVTEAVLAWAREANLLVAGGIEDGIFLAGTVDDFRRALESMPSGPAQLAEVGGTIRRSLPTDPLVQ